MKINSLLFALSIGTFCPVAGAAPAPAPKTKTPPPAKAWKPATNAQRVAAAASVRAQLEAFKRDDWAKAATYQSEGLRRNFGTLAQFRATIETNYPQFADYRSIVFYESRANGDRVEMQVLLTGKDGVKLRAIYQLKKEKGVYRIEGVQGGAASNAAPGTSLGAPGDLA